MVSLIPATPVIISGGRMVSELFVSISHLSLIVNDWLMITMLFKIFKRKGELGFLCGNFKLLVLKSIFLMETT